MSGLLRAALAQINTTVGDIDGNAAKIRESIARAREEGAMLVLFPELTLTGYPPEDLLLKTHFLDAAGEALEQLASEVEDIVAIVRSAPTTSTTPPPCSPTGAWRPSTARSSCRTTASSTSSATSSPGRAGRSSR
jgi:predicted amidohydrolase